MHERQRLRIHLFDTMTFRSEYSRKHYDVLSYIGFVNENPVALNPDIDFINSLLESTRERREKLIHANKFWNLPLEKRAKFATKIHQVLWLPLEEAVNLCDPSKNSFVNDFQKEEFQKLNLKTRDRAIGTWRTVRHLSQIGTVGALRQRLRNFNRDETRRKSFLVQSRQPSSCASETSPAQLRVLSYNLNVLPFEANFHSASGLHGGNTVRRLEFFVADIWSRNLRNVGVDIIALQEVFSSPFLPMFCYQRALIRRLRHLGYHHIVHPTRPPLRRMIGNSVWTDSGLIIASKYPVIEQAVYYFNNRGHGLDAGAQKGALFARVEIDKSLDLYVDVFNVHLQATHNDGGPYAAIRKAQMFELVRFIKQRTSCFSYPYLLTGDFNLDAIRTETCLETGLSYFTTESVWHLSFTGTKKIHEEDFRPVQAESAEYKELINILSSAGGSIPVLNENRKSMSESTPTVGETLLPCNPGIVDLLKEKHEGHVSTRPPRQRFPKNIEYMMVHKYPQRLDYIFMAHGRLGQLVPVISDTCLIRFTTQSILQNVENCLRTYKDYSKADLPFEPQFLWSAQIHEMPNVSDHYGVIALLTRDTTLGTWEFVPPEIETVDESESIANLDTESSVYETPSVETEDTIEDVNSAIRQGKGPKCISGMKLPYYYIRFFSWNSRSWTILVVMLITVYLVATLSVGSTIALLWTKVVDITEMSGVVQIYMECLAFLSLLYISSKLYHYCIIRRRVVRQSRPLYLHLDARSSSIDLSLLARKRQRDFRLNPSWIFASDNLSSSANMSRSYLEMMLQRVLEVQGVAYKSDIEFGDPQSLFLASRLCSCLFYKWNDGKSLAATATFHYNGGSFPLYWTSPMNSLMPLVLYDRDFVQHILRNPLIPRKLPSSCLNRENRDVSTIYDAFLRTVLSHGYQNCLGSPSFGPTVDSPKSTSGIPSLTGETSSQSYGGFFWLTYDDTLSLATFAGSGLLRLGRLVPGDHVGILIESKQKEWALTDLACTIFSLVSECLYVPGESTFSTLLRQSKARTYVVDKSWTSTLLRRLAENRVNSRRLVVIQVEPIEYEQQMLAYQLNIVLLDFDFLVAAGKSYPLRHTPPLDTEPATVVFRQCPCLTDRSRVDFTPVTISHGELFRRVVRFRNTSVGSVFTTSDIHCSYLPYPHEAERCVIHTAWALGMSTGFVPFDLDSISIHLRELKPTFLLSTPRLMEALYSHFLRIRGSWTFPYRSLFRYFFLKKSKGLPKRKTLQDLSYWDDKLFFGKLAERTGTNHLKCILVVVCGSSNGILTRPDVTEFVQVALCCPVAHCVTSIDAGICGISRFEANPVTQQSPSLRSLGYSLLMWTVYRQEVYRRLSPKSDRTLSSARQYVILRAAKGLQLFLCQEIAPQANRTEKCVCTTLSMLVKKLSSESTASRSTSLSIFCLPEDNTKVTYVGNSSALLSVSSQILLHMADGFLNFPQAIKSSLEASSTVTIPAEYSEMLAQVSCGLLKQVWIHSTKMAADDEKVKMVGVIDKEQCFQWALRNLQIGVTEPTLKMICSNAVTTTHIRNSINESGCLLVRDAINRYQNRSPITEVQCIAGLLLMAVTEIKLSTEPFFTGNLLASPTSELNRARIAQLFANDAREEESR